ncbi:MAG: DEAD/DEAH box helicase [Paracoccaceae bacterium]
MDFDMLGLLPRLVEKLAEQGLTEPTPIQRQAIPHAMDGRDVMGLAQTGTGKTAAFGLPMVNALLRAGTKPAPKTVRGLILAPTRELAKQIADHLRAYTEGSHLKVNLVVGGAGIGAQISRLERGTDLLVATPGRLIDLLDRRALSLSETHYLVLDEADQMLDLGFIHALRKIAPLLAEDRQTMLFSATMPKQMAELSRAYLRDPVRVEVAPPGKVADKINQSLHFVAQAGKSRLLIELLGKHSGEQALVFSRTKHGAERLKKQLEAAEINASSIHGNKSQNQRERAIRAFRAGEIDVMVATDVAARGIDIAGIRHVYNFDLPNVAENYVHRIGRTARAGMGGHAIAFCSPAEMSELRAVEKVLKRAIPVAGGTPWQGDVAGNDAAKPSGKVRRAGVQNKRPRNRRRRRKAA